MIRGSSFTTPLGRPYRAPSQQAEMAFVFGFLLPAQGQLTGSAPDKLGRADERGSDGFALVRVRERLVDPLERVTVGQDRAVGVAVVGTLEELEPAPERPRLVAAHTDHAPVQMDQPRGVEGDRLVGGDVTDHDVAALGPRHGDALGERGGMADELEDDVAATPRQVANRLRAGVARGEAVDVQDVVGAEGPGEL